MFNRILLALDRSDDISVMFTNALARVHAASVRVVHINPLILGWGVPQATELEALDIVDVAVALIRAQDIDADGVHCVCDPYSLPRCIAEAAHNWSADAIVLGSMRRRRWPRLRGTGVREGLIAMTELPVIVAPPPLKMELKRAVHSRHRLG